jgi:carbamoyl-phosphate synthase small subunit
LKFGHRGANQPVKELATGRVYITSQNHGYAVVADNGSFVNVNDGTCEGMDYGKSFSVQFHPEARGGPLDTAFLFDRFIERMSG